MTAYLGSMGDAIRPREFVAATARSRRFCSRACYRDRPAADCGVLWVASRREVPGRGSYPASPPGAKDLISTARFRAPRRGGVASALLLRNLGLSRRNYPVGGLAKAKTCYPGALQHAWPCRLEKPGAWRRRFRISRDHDWNPIND